MKFLTKKKVGHHYGPTRSLPVRFGEATPKGSGVDCSGYTYVTHLNLPLTKASLTVNGPAKLIKLTENICRHVFLVTGGLNGLCYCQHHFIVTEQQ